MNEAGEWPFVGGRSALFSETQSDGGRLDLEAWAGKRLSPQGGHNQAMVNGPGLVGGRPSAFE